MTGYTNGGHDDCGPGGNRLDGTVEGTNGNDLINAAYLGDPDGDRIDAADALLAGAAPNDDLVYAYGGHDTVVAGEGNDKVFGGSGNDSLSGGNGNDTLYGEAGNDVLAGGAGNDVAYGGDEDDTVIGGAGADQIYGGTDQDTVDYSASSGAVNMELDVSASGGDAQGDTLRGIDGVIGSAYDDRIVGFDNQGTGPGLNQGNSDYYWNALYGGAGNDYVDGRGGDDTVAGGAGNDIVLGGAGNDLVYGDAGNDQLDGGAGNDAIFGGNDRDTIKAGAGDAVDGGAGGDDMDVLDLRGLPPYRIENLTTDSNGNGFNGTIVFLGTNGLPTGQTFAFTEIESFLRDPGAPDGTVEGTAGDDRIDGAYLGDPEGDRVDNNDAILPGDVGNDDLIFGFGGNDVVRAGAGNDEAYGGTGNDDLGGGDGNDTLYGEAGNDVIYGGAGNDTAFGGDGNDTIFGNTGNDVSYGGSGNDSFQDSLGSDTVFGGTGDDIIRLSEGGSENMDSVLAGLGNDTVYGGYGDDRIDTSDGGIGLFDNPYPGLPGDANPSDDRDLVYGGTGNDTIRTGDDADTVYGGDGNDVIDAGIDNDTSDGGAGNDSLVGNEGSDTIFGGAGNDVINGGLPDGFPDSLNIRDDQGDLVTNNGRDVIDAGSGDDVVKGQDDDDSIIGGSGNDLLDGGIDDDTIAGGTGNDTIIGGQGTDTLSGNDDRDLFLGGNGGDAVDGGAGGDDFDTLNLTGSNVDFIEYTSADREDGVVHYLDGSTSTFEEIENVIPCFTPGTMIATPRGEKPVEELREGDRVITRDNGIQEIRWVGRKEVSGKALVGAPHLRPVLVKAGSLGHGLPERDMLVSPNHRILVANDRTQLYFEENEVLAAAKHMTGTPGIHQVDALSVTYIHLMFERHEVVLSNGAWTESFQPGDWSLKGIGNAQRNELLELFPELRTQAGVEGFQAARKSLKRHEAKLLVR